MRYVSDENTLQELEQNTLLTFGSVEGLWSMKCLFVDAPFESQSASVMRLVL
jgi:hypothetical protein